MNQPKSKTVKALCKKCKSEQQVVSSTFQVFSIEYCYKCLKFTKFIIKKT